MKLSKELIEKIQKQGWIIGEYDKNSKEVEIRQASPAGEDFGFDASGSNDEEIIASIKEYADYFDVDEHASIWFGQNNGEPNTLTALLQDARAIKQMLLDLSNEVSGEDGKPNNLVITDDDLSSNDREKITEMINEYLSEQYGSPSGGYGYEIEIRLSDIDWEDENEEDE